MFIHSIYDIIFTMATSKDFIDFVHDQLAAVGGISSKKMFGEYMVYAGGKPVLLVCDDTVFVKMLPQVAQKFKEHGIAPETGFPYDGAKEHYVLDIENSELTIDMVRLLEEILPMPKPKKSQK